MIKCACVKLLLILWITSVYSEARKSDDEPLENSLDYEEEEENDFTSLLQLKLAGDLEADIEENRETLEALPTDYSIVYPVQVRRNKLLSIDTHDLKSKHKNAHFHHTSVLLVIFGKRYRIKLTLNRDLLSRDVKQKTNINSKTQIIEESSTENCYYHGYIRKKSDSLIAVTTCNGISGWIHVDNTSFVIQPLRISQNGNESLTEGNWTRHPHVLYRPLPAKRKTCGNERGMWQSFRVLHEGEFVRRMKIMKATQGEFDTLAEVKHAELALVCDNSLFRRLNSSVEDAIQYLLQTANILDAYYKVLNVRVRVAFLEVWNVHDLLAVSTNARMSLHGFMNYRADTMDLFPLDMALLISGREFDEEEAGMAVPDSVCSQRAVAVSQAGDVRDPLQTSSMAAHMMAHMLGIHHQQEDCRCGSPEGCLMMHSKGSNGASPGHQFSVCSQVALQEAILSGLGSCMLDNPPKAFSYIEAFQASFRQQCGNGVVERGEECDCMSVQECALKDPCCDPSTCLLRAWATCRHGDCCHNCTVMSVTQMCRPQETECDVPEYCDGRNGQCPANALIQDGWDCRGGRSYCYRGLCRTYPDQCQFIWGAGSDSGDDKCFETFNTAGRFDGHCRFNETADEYIKCHSSDVKCGLLHCTGGDKKPRIGKGKMFSATHVHSDGNDYECKIVSTPGSQLVPNFGMVQDGTACREGHLCLATKCTPLSALGVTPCPVGTGGLVCSGFGICTSESRCFCHTNYTGLDCSTAKNLTAVAWGGRETTTEEMSQPTIGELLPVGANTPVPAQTTSAAAVRVRAGVEGPTTMWLIIVLASVAGGALLLLACVMLCYRRKSPVHGKKRKKRKGMFGSITSFTSSNSKGSNNGNESVQVNPNRIISFGNMPSYRADKIKKAMKKFGTTSETESEHSRSERDSTEVKLPATLPLARPPERGILKKKYPHSADDLNDMEGQGSDSSLSFPSERDPLQGQGASTHDMATSTMPSLHMEETDNMLPPPYEPGVSYPLDEMDGGLDEDLLCDCGEECDSCCSSIDRKELSDFDEDDDEMREARDQQTQTDLEAGATSSSIEMPRDTSSDSLEGAKSKIIKLKNINELLKQIDEQFNSVLRQTTEGGGDASPSNSDELRGSETEADRNFPRNSFYKQSDFEEGFSPPHRSPVLSPNPSTQRSSTRYSSNLSGDSPEPPLLPSPSGALSPIHSRSPPQLLSPGSQGSGGMGAVPRQHQHSTPKDVTTGYPVKHSTPVRPSPAERGVRQTSPSRIPLAKGRSGSRGSMVKDSPSPSKEAAVSTSFPGSPRRQSPPKSSTTQPQPGSPQRTPPQLSPAASQSLASSPGHKREPPVRAVPYRGAAGSVPGSPPLQTRARQDPESESSNPSSKHSTLDSTGSSLVSSLGGPQPANGQAEVSSGGGATGGASPYRPTLFNKLTHPLFDGFPFKKRNTPSHDGQSTSEGYHSDKADAAEEPIIIREIPGGKPANLHFIPNPNGAYTKAPGSPGSPEDINV